MTLREIQDDIIAEFDFLEDWNERYEYIVDLGKTLPIIKPEHKNADNLISGCQSQVWLHAEMLDNKIVFTAEADAILGKGVISLLLRVFSNRTPKEILETEIDFIEKIGLRENLSPTRANGLMAVIKQLKLYAVAFS